MSTVHSTFTSEARALTRLALPIVLTQLSMMSLGLVDLLMVGRVPGDAVAAIGAVALGNVWKVGTLMAAMGLVFGIDPFVSQSHGSGDVEGMARALQRGIVIALVGSVPVAVALSCIVDAKPYQGIDE